MFVSTAIPAFIEVKRAGIDAALGDSDWLILQAWNLGTQGVLAGLSLYLIAQFIMRRRRVPQLMVILFSSTFVLGIVNSIITAINVSTAGAKSGSANMFAVLFRLGIVALWIRYFQNSQRVKETFVRE